MSESFGAESGGDEVEELLCEILQRPTEQHEAALRDACALRQEYAHELREQYAMLLRMGLVAPGRAAGDFPERLGDFRLVERLGGGGMGVVYLAQQESLGRDVALKLMRPDQLYFPGARERFRRETEAVAQLQHPNVVPIYTVGEEEGIPFFAMELVRGCTLAEALEELADRAPDTLTGQDLGRAVARRAGSEWEADDAGLFSGTWPGTCLRVLAPIAAALEHCHERGIVHRDVKPSNIVLRPGGGAMLVDFGLTRSAGFERVTRSGAPIGTLLYMSPEQVRADPDLDARTDVYSLGATLHEMLTLEPPFTGTNPLVIQRAILEGRAAPLRTSNRRISADVETVCRHAMEPERERRYASAQALGRDMENVLALRPIEVQPPGPWARFRRWAQRNPALVAVVLLAFLLLVGTPTGFLLQQRAHATALEGQVVEAREEAQTATRAMDFLTDVLLARELKELDDPDPRLSEVLLRGGELLERREEALAEPLVRARMHFVLGHVLVENGRFADALPYLESARAAFEELPPDRDPEIRRTALLDLAVALTTARRMEEAEARILEVLSTSGSEDDNFALRAKGHLSTLYFDLERFEESLRLAREVLASADPDAPDHALIRASALGMLAQNEHHAGDSAASLEHADESLAIFVEILPSAHTGIARAKMTRAHALMGLGRFDEAAATFEEAIRVLDELSGEPSEVRGQALYNLAFAQNRLGRREEALDTYRWAEEEFTATLGPEAVGVGHCRYQIGILCERAGDAQGAIAAFEVAVMVFEREYGPGHLRTGNAHLGLAGNLLAAGTAEAAVEHFRLAADVFEPLEGQEQFFLSALSNLMASCLERGDSEPAVAAAARVVRMFEERLPADDPRRQQVLSWAVRAYEASGQHEEAARVQGLIPPR